MGTPAEEFGPYVVYEQLGLGGMATVHRAETQGIAGFSKQVALKRMLPSVAADASLVKSFIREARLASHLRHANVAQTYDLGKVGSTYFIAMELVPGRNLREILRHCSAVCGHMPVPIALNIITQICDALDYAHNLCDDSGAPLGIIHRDVSPANIIVSEGGVVKLIDFGIAKASARSGMQTQSGTIKGKFGYMAPEYLMGSIDSRADLFALGVIAHELLANRPLFQGKDDMDTLYRVKDMPILAPSQINPKVPPELDAVIMTALDRNPEQRWQRANALRQALDTEIKQLNLVAHNSQVHEWLDRAFQQTKKKSLFEESSEPVISISEGTSELPRAQSLAAMTSVPRGTPRREVPDEFSSSDGMATIVKPTGSRPIQKQPEPSWHKPNATPDDWNGTTDATTPAASAIAAGDSVDWKVGTDLPTQLVRKSAPQAAAPDPQRREKSGRVSSPHVVARNTPVPRNTPAPQVAKRPAPGSQPARPDERTRDSNRQLIADDASDDDDIRTLPPRSDRRDLTEVDATDEDDDEDDADADDLVRTLPPRSDRSSAPPANTPGLAPRSDALARTMMSEPPRADRPSQPMPMAGGTHDPLQRTVPAERNTPAPAHAGLAAQQSKPPLLRTIPGTGAAPAGPLSPASSGARTTPHLSASEIANADMAAPTRASLDDLAARGERPSAGKLRDVGTVAETKVELAKRSGASNFLLALLVLIAAGGAAAVVYFALPYLT